MAASTIQTVPTLQSLPATLPREGAIELELQQGVLIFRIARSAQDRVEDLLDKQRDAKLTSAEEKELQEYEDIDDYLSFLNRLTRNLALEQQQR